MQSPASSKCKAAQGKCPYKGEVKGSAGSSATFTSPPTFRGSLLQKINSFAGKREESLDNSHKPFRAPAAGQRPARGGEGARQARSHAATRVGAGQARGAPGQKGGAASRARARLTGCGAGRGGLTSAPRRRLRAPARGDQLLSAAARLGSAPCPGPRLRCEGREGEDVAGWGAEQPDHFLAGGEKASPSPRCLPIKGARGCAGS